MLLLLVVGLAGCTPAQALQYENHDSQGAQYPLSGAVGQFASVDAFRHSVGVVIHNNFGSSSYGNAGAIIARLQEAGITHAAGSMFASPDPAAAWFNGWVYTYINQFQRAGITWAFTMGAPNDTTTGTPAQKIAAVDSQIDPGMVDGFVWPNEYDTSGDSNWAANEAAFGATEFAAVKADPMLRDLPVIGPSLVNDNSPPILGNQSGSMDAGGIHPYTQCQSPTPAYDRAQIARAGVTAPGKPVWATEAGNTTALNETSGMRPCSEAVQAVYAVRTYLQHFTDGIGRTYMYELLEESPDPGLTNSEDHFGLLRSDFSEKPAFVAIKNLLGIVGYGAPGTLTPLQYSLSGDTAGDLQHLVLQRANGTYLVALWRTASIWDHNALTDIAVTPEQISVGLPTATGVTSADPLTATATSGLPLRQGNVSLLIGADPVILTVATNQPRLSPAPGIVGPVASSGSRGSKPDKPTASRAGLSAVKRKAKLSFTLASGKNAAALKTITLASSRSLGFSTSKKSLVQGIAVKTDGKRLKFIATVSQGKLTITLKTPASRVQVTIASPAITVSKTLAGNVKHHKIRTLRVLMTATDTSHTTTRITLQPGAK